ncbi:MAG: HAD family phosphatase [Planctomycetia bacterium]|nr:HAD family phosphatase [Planctomycetia bacterium]
MQPRFFYFDLGNVVLNFDHRLAARQMGEVAGVAAEKVWEIVFAGDLELRYEAGEIGDREFYEIFCRQAGTRPDFEALLLAGSAIFTPNTSIFPVVAALNAAGYRLGILSNTCPGHWAYCTDGRYGLMNQSFEVFALSYELGACKPSAKIFQAAAKLAGVAPTEIFFVDDIARNVEGARAVGFDAVQYTTTQALVADLRERGLEFNY